MCASPDWRGVGLLARWHTSAVAWHAGTPASSATILEPAPAPGPSEGVAAYTVNVARLFMQGTQTMRHVHPTVWLRRRYYRSTIYTTTLCWAKELQVPWLGSQGTPTLAPWHKLRLRFLPSV